MPLNKENEFGKVTEKLVNKNWLVGRKKKKRMIIENIDKTKTKRTNKP